MENKKKKGMNLPNKITCVRLVISVIVLFILCFPWDAVGISEAERTVGPFFGVQNIDLKYIITETDSPYLAPVPKRGKRNESAFVPYIAEFLSTVYGCTVEHLAKVTTCNANRLFSKITRL